MRKILVVLSVVAVLAIPTVAQAAYSSGSCSSPLTISFSNATFVGGLGWSSGTGRTISSSGSCSNCQFFGIYGWGTNPLVEYYIGRSGGTYRGSYSCGTLYTSSCNGPNLTGSGPFQQYNVSGSSKDMGCHNSGWSGLGYGTNMGGGYQVHAAENYSGGSGNATINVSGANWYTLWTGGGSATHTCGGGGSTTTTSGWTSTTTTAGWWWTTTTSGSTTTTSGGGGTWVVRARSTDGAGQLSCKGTNWTAGTSYSNKTIYTSDSSGTVCFTNDTGGRDVVIDYVVVQGSTRQAEDQSYNTGVWQNGCGGSYSEWLHCNGCIGF